jgi:hypothetical protein
MPRPQRRQARAARSRMRAKIEFYPYPPPWLHQSCSYKRVSSVGRFYDGLRAARWPAERHNIMPQRRGATGATAGGWSKMSDEPLVGQRENLLRASANRLSACGIALRPWSGRTLLPAAVLDPSGQASPAERQPCRTAGARFTAARVLGRGRRRA